MELKEGMYVRYKYEEIVFIGKITFISEVVCGLGETLQIDIDNCMEEILKRDIIKASHNIIDLIEVGDYVNGYKVVDIKIFSDGNKYVVIATEEHQSFWKDKVFEDEIKSIVTSQQFESMSYKVGGKE